MKALLVIKGGPAHASEHVLDPARTYVVGRAHDADIVVAHPSVSRGHFKLAYVPPGKWLISDLGSSNGTIINRRRITTEALAAGETIRIGLITLEFRVVSEPGSAAPAPAPSQAPPCLAVPKAERSIDSALPAAMAREVPKPAQPVPLPPRPSEARAPARPYGNLLLLAVTALAGLALAGAIAYLVLNSLRHRPELGHKAQQARTSTRPTPQARVRKPPRVGTVVKSIKLDDEKGFTPLHAAVRKGVRGDVEALLSKGAGVNAWDTVGRGLQPLHVAAVEGHREVAELLLDKGADPNGGNVLGTPLHVAAANNDVLMALLLLDRGSGVGARDPQRGTPLHVAAARGAEEAAELLVESGAEVASWTSEGLTPLHLAAGNGHVGVLRVLLAAGADPNLANSYGHRTPLHEAASRGRKAAAELLLGKGANANARTSAVAGGGSTPLHEAARAGHREMVKFLLSCGADPRAKNADGRTPRDEALAGSHKEVAELLAH